jgi:hypothetical protein
MSRDDQRSRILALGLRTIFRFWFFRDVLGENHWFKRGRWARLFAGAWRVRYAWRPAGPRTVVREPVPAARRPLRIARREIGSGRAWSSTFKVLA